MFVHKSNREVADALLGLRDEKGRPALDDRQCRILEIVGRFDRKNGNYMSLKGMLNMYPGRKLSLKTFRRHIRYFEDQGIISCSLLKGRVTRRLSVPDSLMVESLAAYRTRTGMKEYAYRDENRRMKPVSGSSFFAQKEGKIFPSGEANFALTNKDEVSIKDNIEKNNLPKSLLAAPNVGPSALNAAPSEPHKRGYRRVPTGGIHAPSKGNESEPISKGRTRRSRTQAERSAEAGDMISRGHITNPLGKPNSVGRRLKPSMARPVDPASSAAVTTAQLYRAYVEAYDESFGIPGLLEQYLPPTREAMDHFIGRLRQTFYDTCGYGPSNREIWEYIEWFHEPAMLVGIRKVSNRIPDHPGVPHPNQLMGRVYVRSFYEKHLARKNQRPAEMMSSGEMRAREARDLVETAYNELRAAGDRDFDLVLCLVTYGFVIFSEYLRDARDLGPSDAKRYIINLMARYLANAKDKSSARSYLERAYQTTERLPIQDSSLWSDWKIELKDALGLAVESSARAPQGLA